MATAQKTLLARGRLYIDKNSDYPISMPFNKIQYIDPDGVHSLGSILFQLIEDGQQLMSHCMSLGRMNIRKYNICGEKYVEMQMIDRKKSVEVRFF